MPNGEHQLKRDHAYYYQVSLSFIIINNNTISTFCMQVQAQLFCTKANYCDFVVYTKTSLHTERIKFDECFWEVNIEKVKHFFDIGIMPELLGRWFSRPPERAVSMQPTSSSNSLQSNTNEGPSTSASIKYCYCQGDEYGDMVGCDNDECVYKWFHLECLRLKSPPKSKEWYCPDCRKLDKYKKRRKKS